MATAGVIISLTAIPGIDKLVMATVAIKDATALVNVVVDKTFKVDDIVMYCPPGVWVPLSLTSVCGKKKYVYGIPGVVIKAKIVCGVKSEGILLPYLETVDYTILRTFDKVIVPVNGHIKGDLPAFCLATGSKRFDKTVIDETQLGHEFEITEKLEGASMTVYRHQGKFGVCSHHKELKPIPNNAYWHVAKTLNIEENMTNFGMDDLEINGELVGPQIQGNIYILSDYEFYVFSVRDLKNQCFLAPAARYDVVKQLNLEHVPIIEYKHMLTAAELETVKEKANGFSKMPGAHNARREGLFYKQVDGNVAFKVISSTYLQRRGVH